MKNNQTSNIKTKEIIARMQAISSQKKKKKKKDDRAMVRL